MMGSTKEHWFELQEQLMIDWIQNYLSDPEADENTEGWEAAISLYAGIQEEMAGRAELEAEYQWHWETSYLKYFEMFLSEIENTKQILNGVESSNQAMLKMVCSHSITVLESYLGDYIKCLIIKEPEYLNNFIENDDLAKAKYSLRDFHKEEHGVVGLVLKSFNKTSFHNVKQVVNIFNAMFACKLDMDISDISKAIDLRHDLIHRNGKSINGHEIVLNVNIATEFIKIVEDFARELQSKVTDEINSQ